MSEAIGRERPAWWETVERAKSHLSLADSYLAALRAMIAELLALGG